VAGVMKRKVKRANRSGAPKRNKKRKNLISGPPQQTGNEKSG
jgi:hypothetical protein